MSEQKKKPGAAFWATVVVVMVLVAYPLSFGPACWITSQAGGEASALSTIYQPILQVLGESAETSYTDPSLSARALRWFACLAAAPGWDWYPRHRREWISGPHGRLLYDRWYWEWSSASRT